MMDEGDDGLNLAARILIFAWPATSVSQIHKGCHRHSWRKKDTDAAKRSPAPACAEIPLLSTDDTAAQSPATAAAAAAAASSGDGNSSQGGKPPPSPPSCLLSDMACLSSYEIDGLRRLLAELNVSTTMVRVCPEELGDPGELMSTVEILLN
ncbi:uncharacterized protein LOC135828223 isoform X2 [Sycon ciliatum]|uniref:uncharacterized protein LOC135828223 isoform X2 n=1 Tax=Sycon ciliatum TaxID=27933 RepID=UPI0031F702C1